jgi:putative peptidoglycan lipid II flippase
LVSRITGVGRVIALAAVLGPTYFGNLYQTTNTLPNIIHVMLVGSLVTAILVPAIVRHLDQSDAAGAVRLANGFLGTIVLAGTMVMAICIIGGPYLMSLMTAAVADAEVRNEQLKLAWPLLILILPQIVFYAIAATAVAVQQAHGKFALPAAAPALENIGTILVMGASAWLYGTGLESQDISLAQLVLIGAGSTGAVALHAAAQWWGAYRLGVSLVPQSGWRNHEVRQVIRLAVPSSGYATLNSLTLFGLFIISSAIPGGAVALQIGLNFFSLPIALGAYPVAAALLPRLTRGFDHENASEVASIYRDSLALANFVALPATLIFVCLSETLARAVSFGEMSSSSGTSLVAAAIGSLGLGIVGESIFVVATAASYARRDAIAPLRAMACRAILAFVGMTFALLATSDVATIWALGLSFSIATLTAAGYLHQRRLRPRVSELLELGARVAPDMLASIASVIPGWLVAYTLTEAMPSHYGSIILAIMAIGASGVTYLAIQWMRNSREFSALFARFSLSGQWRDHCDR